MELSRLEHLDKESGRRSEATFPQELVDDEDRRFVRLILMEKCVLDYSKEDGGDSFGSEISSCYSGPKDLEEISRAFDEKIPSNLKPFYDEECSVWCLGRPPQTDELFEFRIDLIVCRGIRDLIPETGGPCNPEKFVLFTPFLGGVTISNVPELTSSSTVLIDRILFKCCVAGNLAEYLRKCDGYVPLYFAYLDVALAFVKINVELEISGDFESQWGTMLYGFQPSFMFAPSVAGIVRIKKIKGDHAFETPRGSLRNELLNNSKAVVEPKTCIVENRISSDLFEGNTLESHQCEFRLRMEGLRMPSSVTSQDIIASFWYPLFGFKEHYTEIGSMRAEHGSEKALSTIFSAPTKFIVEAFLEYPLTVKLYRAGDVKNCVGFAKVQLRSLFDKPEAIVKIQEQNVLRNECFVKAMVKSMDSSTIVGYLDLWLCLDDLGSIPVSPGRIRRDTYVVNKVEFSKQNVVDIPRNKNQAMALQNLQTANQRLKKEAEILKKKMQDLETAHKSQIEKRGKDAERLAELSSKVTSLRKLNKEKHLRMKQLELELQTSSTQSDILKRQISQLERELSDLKEMPKIVAVQIQDALLSAHEKKEALEIEMISLQHENKKLKDTIDSLNAQLQERDSARDDELLLARRNLHFSKQALIAQEASFFAKEESRLLEGIRKDIHQYFKSTSGTNGEQYLEELPSPEVQLLEEELKTLMGSGLYSSRDAVIIKLRSAIAEARRTF
ncbi:unnamed protein product [Notodromas monacha]|uniref:Uncharacterized protein n=1 Tax=Notodromas monacha TaxID=399045 RepID=A0A7R9BI34_9CRUS|nr:unnamed protein product [Notodromas monacha]CAG0915906.1 unnamed protein product [Notodromas monacha]